MRILPGMIVAAVFGCGCDDRNVDRDDRSDLTEEVVSCEEAISRVARCCPGFDAKKSGSCVDASSEHRSAGCETREGRSSVTRPELTLRESRCVRELSCQAIIDRGICDAVTKNGSIGSWSAYYDEPGDSDYDYDEGETYPHEAVCP